MESTISTIRQMNYKKQIVTSAVYDILDKNSAVYHRDKNSGEISAEVMVYDNSNTFRILVEENDSDEKSSMRIVCASANTGLSEKASQRAVNFLADSVEQLLENELLMTQPK